MEGQNIILFTIVSKTIKDLGIYLIKEMEDLYTEIYKLLMKENEEYINIGKIAHVYGMEDLILLKCPYYSKYSTDSMQSLLLFHWNFSQK